MYPPQYKQKSTPKGAFLLAYLSGFEPLTFRVGV